MSLDNIHKECLNQIDLIIEKFEENKLSSDFLDKNNYIQTECKKQLNDCFDLVENVDFDETLDSLNYNSNIDILKIKSIIEKILNKNNTNLDKNVNLKLGNIDNRLDELNSKISSQENNLSLYNYNNLSEINNNISNQFKDITSKLNEILENNITNDYSCVSNVEDLKILMEKINDNTNSDPQHLTTEINNLNKKLNQILSNNDDSNENILQKVSILNDKLSNNYNSEVIDQVNNLSHKVNRINNNNEDNITMITNKLRDIIWLIDKQKLDINNSKLLDSSDNQIDSQINKPEKSKGVLNEKEKQKLKELKNNINDLDYQLKNHQEPQLINNSETINTIDSNFENNLNVNKKSDVSKQKEDINNQVKVNNKKKIKFVKNKNPFEYIYDNTDNISFKKINMQGGGGQKIEELKELRKRFIKPYKKKIK